MPESSDMIKDIRLLYEISLLLQSDSKPEEIFKEALKKVKDAVECNSASLFIVDVVTGRLEEVATDGKRVELIESIDFDLGTGFSAWVAKQRKSVSIPNLSENRHKHFRSFVSTPLISGDTLIGVMNLGHDKPDAFSDENLRFFDIIAEQLALLIERTRFENDLIEKNQELLDAQDEIKKQQKRLIEMERFQVLAQTAASINHEINNPLTTVIGNLELLFMARPNMDKMIAQKLTTVLQEARRIAEITQKLRTIKRVVLEDYLPKTGEKMVDIESSSKNREPENLS